MSLGLFFLLGILSLIAGVLTVKDKKPLAKILFMVSLGSFAAGGLAFSLEKSHDSGVIAAYEQGETLLCDSAGRTYEVSRAAGWVLKGGDHFVQEDKIVRAGTCRAQTP